MKFGTRAIMVNFHHCGYRPNGNKICISQNADTGLNLIIKPSDARCSGIHFGTLNIDCSSSLIKSIGDGEKPGTEGRKRAP